MSAAAGVLLGLGAAAGAGLVAEGWRSGRRPGLADRVAPYVSRHRSHAPAAPRAQAEPGPLGTLARLLAPTVSRLSAAVGRQRDSEPAIRARLERAGRAPDVDRYRSEQLLWGLGGLAAGLGLTVLAVARGSSPSAVGVLLLCGVGAVLGVLLHSRSIDRAGVKRSTRMGSQLPTVAELLAFAVAAGETPTAALERVARTVRGDLSAELARAVAEIRSGAAVPDALRAAAVRCGNPAVARFVDGLLVALERGTPLADVLRAQAADARAQSRRGLVESAGKRDAFMLVPVVFLVLPTVVLVALFPGVHGLLLTVP